MVLKELSGTVASGNGIRLVRLIFCFATLPMKYVLCNFIVRRSIKLNVSKPSIVRWTSKTCEMKWNLSLMESSINRCCLVTWFRLPTHIYTVVLKQYVFHNKPTPRKKQSLHSCNADEYCTWRLRWSLGSLWKLEGSEEAVPGIEVDVIIPRFHDYRDAISFL